MTDSCGNCIYWRPGSVEQSAAPVRGLCRRFPSGIEKTAGEWCGEHPFAAAERQKTQATAIGEAVAAALPAAIPIVNNASKSKGKR